VVSEARRHGVSTTEEGIFKCERTSWREGCSQHPFYRSGGEVRGRRRQDSGGQWAVSMVTVFGRGDTRVPLDEGSKGGMSGALLRLHPNAGGQL
jgi:hypothetical protein